MGSFSLVHWMIFAILLLLMFPLYFVPSIVAVVRDHQQKVAIILVNFFFGWSGCCWLRASLWIILGKSNSEAIKVA